VAWAVFDCSNSRAVYIGRAMPSCALPRSKWANHFTIGRDGTPDEVIAKYERHLYDSEDVHELRGCNLVCWCAPLPCHGDLLVRLANA